MVHLKLNAVYLDGICDFFHHLRFYGACSNRKGGGPLMAIHGFEWVTGSWFKKSKFGLNADQELDPKFFDSISGGPGVSASATFVAMLQVAHRNSRDKTVRGQKGTSKDDPLVRGTDTCSWKNPKKTACPGA